MGNLECKTSYSFYCSLFQSTYLVTGFIHWRFDLLPFSLLLAFLIRLTLLTLLNLVFWYSPRLKQLDFLRVLFLRSSAGKLTGGIETNSSYSWFSKKVTSCWRFLKLAKIFEIFCPSFLYLHLYRYLLVWQTNWYHIPMKISYVYVGLDFILLLEFLLSDLAQISP